MINFFRLNKQILFCITRVGEAYVYYEYEVYKKYYNDFQSFIKIY
jgi:hypothetical protein